MYLLYHRDAGFVSNCLDSEEGDDIELMQIVIDITNSTVSQPARPPS